MTSRVFTMQDQENFAILSGDSNPMHVDAIQARRYLFGRPVVHGIAGVLWGLDTAIRTEASFRLTSLSARFISPILVGDPVTLVIEKQEAGSLTLGLEVGGSVCTRIEVAWQSGPDAASIDLPNSPVLRPIMKEPAIAALEGVSGKLLLFLDMGLCRRLFPTLADLVFLPQLAQILATTRLVGMEVPGLNSIFNELKMRFSPPERDVDSVSYSVRKLYPKFGRVSLALDGPGVEGRIEASYRPAPHRQPTSTELREQVDAGRFAGQRALVVGGSRGLGEVTAKLLAAGGAWVLITYNQGAQDARRVLMDIDESGSAGHSRCRLDVGSPEESLPSAVTEFSPTHIYYFATPHIGGGRAGPFDKAKFERFCEIYAYGFHRLLTNLPMASPGPIHVLYPSSIYLDEPETGMQEYAAAKSAGETVCTYLMGARSDLKIHRHRLPRLSTDQTASLIARENQDPVSILLPILTRMAATDP